MDRIRPYPRAKKQRSRYILLVLLLLFFPTLTTAEKPKRFSEYNAKYLAMVNLIKFTKWPQRHPDTRSLDICLIGDRPLYESWKGAKTRTIGGRRIRMFFVTSSAEVDAKQCRVLFVPIAAQSQQADLIKTLAGKPILTVGESKDFLQDGGAINLHIQNRRLRFDINKTALERSSLTISSRVLKLASRVVAI